MAKKNFRNRSVMNHDFSMLPSTNIKRSVFNRTSGYKTTFDSGFLVPFFVDEALPGDTFQMKVSMITRLTTPIVPIMDNMKLDYFFFSVPNRLVWDNWQKFMGEQAKPGDSTDYLIPQIKTPDDAGWGIASMADYFGLPTGVSNLSVSALPFRAYNLIFNEWFRDQNLVDPAHIYTGDADEVLSSDSPDTEYQIRRRGKRHDYFTSCLPWPQKGDGVELSLGTPQLEFGDDLHFTWQALTGLDPENNIATGTIGAQAAQSNLDLGRKTAYMTLDDSTNEASDYILTGIDPDSSGMSITNADALTINSLRQAFQLQRLLERDARGGTRYTEILRSHFGVISPDSRVQRPEYLGGGTYDINVAPVVQNSASDQTTPQGNLAAIGLTAGVKNGFNHSFTEHCVVIGIACVRADLTYQQGIPRMFSRQTRYDHYWPTLAHLGEQAVLNKEIYAQGTDDDNKVFGYQERFAEYRYGLSKITGKLRSTAPDTLDVWHLSQKFENLPTLNEQFIAEDPPVDRVIAVQNEPQFIMDVYFDLKCARPMPTYSVPGYIDHF